MFTKRGGKSFFMGLTRILKVEEGGSKEIRSENQKLPLEVNWGKIDTRNLVSSRKVQ